MSNKPFKGKCLYQPAGAAAEYFRWACNFYTGCTNRCSYCYNAHGVARKVLAAPEVTLRKCFVDTSDALRVFTAELTAHRDEVIAAGGIFFSFVSDPMLPSTAKLTIMAAEVAMRMGVPVIILTKCSWWAEKQQTPVLAALSVYIRSVLTTYADLVSLGFTLTGLDADHEQNCLNNTHQRIQAMRWAFGQHIRTWASIEPVIRYGAALMAICDSLPYCHHYKIGLASRMGIRYQADDVLDFVQDVNDLISNYGGYHTVYWKQSVRKALRDEMTIIFEHLPFSVGDDYRLFARS